MDVFEAIADPVRRQIVELLAPRRLAAGRVAAAFTEISRPAVSRHLRVLREAGVVEADLVGRERIYRTRPEALEEVERWAAGLRPTWQQHLDALETEVHRTRREREAARGQLRTIRAEHQGADSMTIEPTGRVETTRAGRRLVIVRTFEAPIEDVWASLTEPERFARWYGTMVGEPGPGKTVMVTMTAEKDAVPEPARILACDPPRSFAAQLGDQDQAWRVSLELIEAAGVTTMTFVHDLTEGIDATDVGPGWEYYADRLEASRNGSEMPDWEADGYQGALGAHYAP